MQGQKCAEGLMLTLSEYFVHLMHSSKLTYQSLDFVLQEPTVRVENAAVALTEGRCISG